MLEALAAENGWLVPFNAVTLAPAHPHSPSSSEALTELAGKYGIHGLRLPLHMCITVSPCILFLNTHIHKRSVDRVKLAEVWTLLSNHPYAQTVF